MPFPSFTALQPRARMRSVTDIPVEELADADLVVLDVDNTLVEPETVVVPPPIQAWIRALRARTRVLCISNSLSIRRRQKTLEHILGCPMLHTRAKKPFRRVWAAVEALTGVRPSARTVVIGDRVFSDMLFGNWVGAHTILVEPFSNKEAWWIRLIRPIERFLAPAAARKKRT